MHFFQPFIKKILGVVQLPFFLLYLCFPLLSLIPFRAFYKQNVLAILLENNAEHTDNTRGEKSSSISVQRICISFVSPTYYVLYRIKLVTFECRNMNV